MGSVMPVHGCCAGRFPASTSCPALLHPLLCVPAHGGERLPGQGRGWCPAAPKAVCDVFCLLVLLLLSLLHTAMDGHLLLPPGNPCWIPHACWLPDLQRPLINPFGDPCVSLLPRRQDRKDKEKEKRMRGQSTHAQWKSEVGGTALVGGRQLEAADMQCGLQVHPTRCTPCPCSLHPTAAGGDGAAPAVRLRGCGSARLCPGAASCAANRSVLFWKPFVTCKSVAAVWAFITHRNRQQRAFCGSARQA